jgi:O-6-methylguanine DNA methyltransferase
MRLRLERRRSPLGNLLLVTCSAGKLRALDFFDFEDRMRRLLRLHYGTPEIGEAAAPATVSSAVDAYFDGDVTAVGGIPVETGGTAFQRSVWAALRAIPAGETRGYGALASMLGRPSASRAVGMANGANPVGIVVPCHRVIGASGALTGYAGGVERKRWLLAHEGAATGSSLS